MTLFSIFALRGREMSDTGFTEGQREKMICTVDLNGYEQDGEGPRFICLDSGEVLEFPNCAQVFDFIRARFTRQNAGLKNLTDGFIGWNRHRSAFSQ